MATINLGNVDFAILFQGSGTLTASYSASLIGGGGIAGGACGTPGAGTSATLIGGGGIGGGTLGTPGQSLYVVSLIGGGGIAGGTLGQGSILASGSYAVTLIGGGGIAGGSISAAQSGDNLLRGSRRRRRTRRRHLRPAQFRDAFSIGGLVVDRSQLTSADDYLAAYVYFDCTQIAGFDPTQQYWFRYRQVAADPGPWSPPFLLGFTTPLDHQPHGQRGGLQRSHRHQLGCHAQWRDDHGAPPGRSRFHHRPGGGDRSGIEQLHRSA